MINSVRSQVEHDIHGIFNVSSVWTTVIIISSDIIPIVCGRFLKK